MKIKDLIKELQSIPNQDARVSIVVGDPDTDDNTRPIDTFDFEVLPSHGYEDDGEDGRIELFVDNTTCRNQL